MLVARNTAIHKALGDHLKAYCEANEVPLALQDCPFPLPPRKRKPNLYLQETFIPNATLQRTLGNEPQFKRGLYQVSVWSNSKRGLEQEKQLADGLVDLFANQTLYEGSVQVKIPTEPYWSGPLHDDGWAHIPVTISYTCEV